MKSQIKQVSARQVLDSRGNPTIEVMVSTGENQGYYMAPSGASKGTEEAYELRDGEDSYHGKSVYRAIENLETIIAPAIISMDVRDQEDIDIKLKEIDATPNKRILGGNTCIAVSIAVAKCASACIQKEPYNYLNEKAAVLPIPFMNVINGGMHGGNELNIQEHMLAPIGAKNYSEAVRMCCEIFYSLKKNLNKDFGKAAVNVGDEGGFAPPLHETADALQYIINAIDENGYSGKVKLALDAAASSFFKDGCYHLDTDMKSDELLDYYVELCRTFPVVSIEDAFHEDDWQSFTLLTKKVGSHIQIVGDDIFVTNPNRLRKGIKQECCNALLLKPNQIGTLTETIEVAKLSFKHNYNVMVSHRSGDSCNSFIADLSVALGTGQIKSGAPARGERVAKYNRLLKIEQLIQNPVYAGDNWKKTGL